MTRSIINDVLGWSAVFLSAVLFASQAVAGGAIIDTLAKAMSRGDYDFVIQTVTKMAASQLEAVGYCPLNALGDAYLMKNQYQLAISTYQRLLHTETAEEYCRATAAQTIYEIGVVLEENEKNKNDPVEKIKKQMSTGAVSAIVADAETETSGIVSGDVDNLLSNPPRDWHLH